MSIWFIVLSLVTVVAYALVGGVFLAFSDFIMRSLARSAGGAGAMQTINREVFRWVFMTLFLGLAPISIGLAIYGLVALGGSAGILIAAAGLTFILGCFGLPFSSTSR